MKYCLCFLLIAITQLYAGDGASDTDTNVLVRLVQVNHSGSELQSLVASLEPIRISQAGGGGRGLDSFPPPTAETAIGKQFTVTFIRPKGMTAHEQTLWHMIQSCASRRGTDVSTLKLHLVLSIPAKAAKQLSSDADRDFSQWIIMSADTFK
jgi:hypothetical protein